MIQVLLTEGQVNQAQDFAKSMAYGVGHTNSKKFGGKIAKLGVRNKNEIYKNQLCGKLSEIAFFNFVKTDYKDYEISEVNFEVYGKGISDTFDFNIKTGSKSFKVAIKSSSNLKSKWLLLECNAYNSDLDYIKERIVVRHDIFIFALVDLNKPNIVNLCGAISRNQLLLGLNDSNNKKIIKIEEGTTGVLGNIPMKVSNYACYIDQLKFKEKAIPKC